MSQEENKSKRFTPARILLYFLTPIVFLFAGAAVSSLLGAADGQGLAGGAIVIFYGFITAAAALVLALIVSPFLSAKTVRKLNLILFIIVFLGGCWITYRIMSSDKDQKASEFKPVPQKTSPIE